MKNDLNSERFEKQDYPLNQIYFYLTEGCNLACRHCWLAPGFESRGIRYPVLPLELFEAAIGEARALGLSGVKLTGGEPLLHPRFLNLLEIIGREDLSLNMESNGLLCTHEIAAEIARFPNRFVSISMDGADASTHDWVRGVPGSFERAKEAVRNLVDTGTPPQIIMSLMRCNAGQVDEMVQLAEHSGASSLKFNIVMPIARGEALQEADMTLDIQDIIQLGRYVEMELTPKTELQLLFDYPPSFRPLSHMAGGDGNDTCGILGILGVIPTGRYALCGIGEHLPELVFGRVGEDRLEEVWQENMILNRLRAGLPDQLEGICGRCLMKYQCLGSCIAQNYYRSGSLWAPFWFCEEAEKEGLFPDTRLESMKAYL